MTAPHGEAQEDLAGGEVLDVVVVGGSQAGLDMAWHLAQQGLRFVVWRPPLSSATPGGPGGTR
jgi:ribulose 1,5-bisphosphate synthetase/thiazole synthase